MLKGHAKIELTDVNTGKKEIYEHDNKIFGIVGTQISEMAKMAEYSDINERYLPIYDKAMGGILLLNSTKEYNGKLPPLSPLVGYASNNVSPGTDNKRGSKNIAESGFSENGKSYKFVWDFSTSQANGTIAALALTSSKCGALPYGIHSGTAYYNFQFADIRFSDAVALETSQAVNYDFGTNIVTCARVTSTTTVKISKYRIPIDEIRLKTTLMTPELVDEQIIDFADSGVTVNANANVISVGNYYYILYASNSSKVTISRIDKSTMSIDENYGETGVMSVSLVVGQTEDGALITTNTTVTKNQRTANAYLNDIVIAYRYYILTISPETGNVMARAIPNDVTGTVDENLIYTVGEGDGIIESGSSFLINNRFIAELPAFGYSTIVETRKSQTDNPLVNPSSATPPRAAFINSNDVIVEFTTTGIMIGSTMDYMATINVLDTPVVKTAAQSMKITYTLTEA